jgi:hypothetical protein
LQLLLDLPPLRVGNPHTVSEQAIQVGERLVAVDEKPETFAVSLARPPSIPYLPSLIFRIKVPTAERLPTAMRIAFNVAAFSVKFTGADTTIWAVLGHLIVPASNT